MSTNKYEKQAEDFLKKTSTSFKAKFTRRGPYFHDDPDSRDIYIVTLSNNKFKYSFTFGQCLAKSSTPENPDQACFPTPYQVLASLQKSPPGSLEDYCSDFGLDPTNSDSCDTYINVGLEYSSVCKLFTEAEIDLLIEIN